MILTSKIKTLFNPGCLDALGKLCDTRRIASVQKKMKFALGIIKRYNPELKFSLLGGATNRLVIFCNGIPIKIALDSQGFKDNLMEYSIGPELQPYVPKPFETNGYILVCHPWRLISQEEWSIRKPEIMRVLDTLAQDYLLGDVGYIKRNYTNWGINDEGSVGILDYAYIHRATPNLFTCEVCGNGILRYDSTYSRLKCSNSTVCNAKYTYIERKMIQGDQVDLDMIAEVLSESLTLKGDKTSIEVMEDDGVLISGNKRIIRTKEEYMNYIKEKMHMDNFNTVDALDLLIDQLDADATTSKQIDQKLIDLVEESEEVFVDGEKVETIVEYDPYEDDEEESEDDEDEEEVDTVDADYALSLTEMLEQLENSNYSPEPYEENDICIGGKDKVSLSSNSIGLVKEYDNIGEIDGISIGGVKKKVEVKEEVPVEEVKEEPKQTSTVIDYTEPYNPPVEKKVEESDGTFSAKDVENFVDKLETTLTDALTEVLGTSSVEVSDDFKGVTFNGSPVTE